MRRLSFTLITFLIAATPAMSQQQQQPALSERLDVNAVLIDTVVTDSRGNQILGLTKDDFVVMEGGKAQTIDSLDYYSTRRLLTGPEEKAPFAVQQVHEERYIIFFFDKPSSGFLFDKIAQARRAVSDFIKKDMGRNDLVAIVGHDVRLKIFSDFTSDKKQLQKALDEAGRFSRGILKSNSPEGGPSILRYANADRLMNHTGRVYEAIELIGDAVRRIPARKNLVLITPGIHEPGEEVRLGALLNTSRYYEPMIQALNSSNITVFIGNLMLEEAPPDPVYHQTLDRIAHDTNGEYLRQAVSFRPLVKKMDKSSGGYYLLTYRMQKPKGESGFQKVDVSIRNHPELRVKARAGYNYGND